MRSVVFRKVFSISVFLLIVLICIYMFLHSSFFAVDKVYVTGNERTLDEEVIKLSGISPGANIFSLNEKLATRSIEVHPVVKKARLNKHLPRSVELHIEERKVWAMIPFEDALLCIDDEGVCLDKVPYMSLAEYPIITVEPLPERVLVGQAVQAEGIKMIRQVWEAIAGSDRQEISDFHFLGNKKELIFYTEKGTEIRWGKNERLEEKAAFFNRILELEKDLDKAGNDALDYVDLRFAGQPAIKTKG